MPRIIIDVGDLGTVYPVHCNGCPNIGATRDALIGETEYRCEIFHVTLEYDYSRAQYIRCDDCKIAEEDYRDYVGVTDGDRD
jgi:hypothetical protein